MADINQEIEQIVAEMREVGKQAAPCKGGNHNNLLRYKELRERILSKFLEVFDAGGRLEMPTLTPPNEWVSVEERLPEKKQDVLMLFDTGNMAVGWWHDADEHITFWCAYTDDGFYTDCDCIPTHWMLLPAPPEKEGDR